MGLYRELTIFRVVDRCENLIHRNWRRDLLIRGADWQGRVVGGVEYVYERTYRLKQQLYCGNTRSCKHFRRVCALNVPSINLASVHRLTKLLKASDTLNVCLNPDIGSYTDPFSFGFIVLSTGSFDDRFFSSLKWYFQLIASNR